MMQEFKLAEMTLKNVICWHFSHVTKSRIFKNFNSRRKADCNFHSNSLKMYVIM